jgi:hypothetical protein
LALVHDQSLVDVTVTEDIAGAPVAVHVDGTATLR